MLFDHEQPDRNKCWFQNICSKYKQNPSICENMDFCVMNYKMNELTSRALLKGKDKYPIPLIPDADGTDKDKFLELRAIQGEIKEFVTQGKNLLIYSKITGNGKTASAKKLLLAWFNSIIYPTEPTCRGLYINVPRFFTELKNNITQRSDYIDYLKLNIPKVELIVWDEIGVKELTNFEHDTLLNYINQRCEEGLANIYTSNMTPIELKERLGDRLYSRIVQSSKLIELNGKDKRALNK